MPFPLLHRVALDNQFGWNHFLANTKYGRDFVPTRDRSVAFGSIWTFKDCADEHEPTATSRGHLRPFLGQIFGQVDSLDSMAN
jgi:hypothetical protein